MVGAPGEHLGTSRCACDRSHDAERLAGKRQHRPLFDVQLEIRVRELLDPLAPHRPGLLRAEGNDSQRRIGQALRCLDRRDDAERAVEAPTGRDAVEMRAGPHPGVASTTEEVARVVARDLESRFDQPARGKLVGRVLLGRVPRAMLRDRVDLVEALPDPHDLDATRSPIRTCSVSSVRNRAGSPAM